MNLKKQELLFKHSWTLIERIKDAYAIRIELGKSKTLTKACYFTWDTFEQNRQLVIDIMKKNDDNVYDEFYKILLKYQYELAYLLFIPTDQSSILH